MPNTHSEDRTEAASTQRERTIDSNDASSKKSTTSKSKDKTNKVLGERDTRSSKLSSKTERLKTSKKPDLEKFFLPKKASFKKPLTEPDDAVTTSILNKHPLRSVTKSLKVFKQERTSYRV